MEVHTHGHRLTAEEADALVWVLGPDHDAIAERTTQGGQRLRAERWRLLPALHEVNDRIGWISPAAIDAIALRLDISPAEVYGVASFYDLFSLTEQPPRRVRACVDLACRATAPELIADLPDGVEQSPCLGLCERAPAALVIEAGATPRQLVVEHATTERLTALAGGAAPEDESEPAATARPQPDDVLLRRVGGDPLDLDAYLAAGGFDALSSVRALRAESVIEMVGASGLVGRGGAAFPTGRKWEAVRLQPATPHYLVCNADESEPGTFKDRTLIENDPFNLLEGIAIAMWAIEATTGYVYLRGEYPRAWRTLAAALDAVAHHPTTAPLFADIDIVMFKGAGAYICGEETAVFSSIEGYRGEPRNKPPFPFEVGLFGKPTAVNNVETLANIPEIVRVGPTCRANRRLFCLSGAVQHPGVYEAEMGLTLRDLIERAGGLKPGAELQAVLLGGAAGAYVGPDDLDLVLDHDSMRDAGLSLGSGVVMVLDTTVDIVDQLVRVAEFFRHESCGQCVPCRVGTVRQHEVLQRLAHSPNAEDLALLSEIERAMNDASICGLGQTAGNAVSVAIQRLGVFGDEQQ